MVFILCEGETISEKISSFYVHILTGDDAKVGEISVHILLDDGEARDTLPNTELKLGIVRIRG